MTGWAVSEHATRVISADSMHPGYLYTWLNSRYGRVLLQHYAYGSVILEIDADMLGSVVVPIVPRELIREIGSLVAEANELRDKAWHVEMGAIQDIRTLIEVPRERVNMAASAPEDQ